MLGESKRGRRTRMSAPPQSPSVILVPLPVFFLLPLLAAPRGFDLVGCVGRTGSRRWGTMAGRAEEEEEGEEGELHVGTNCCQLETADG